MVVPLELARQRPLQPMAQMAAVRLSETSLPQEAAAVAEATLLVEYLGLLEDLVAVEERQTPPERRRAVLGTLLQRLHHRVTLVVSATTATEIQRTLMLAVAVALALLAAIRLPTLLLLAAMAFNTTFLVQCFITLAAGQAQVATAQQQED